jgi:osmotically-inducible protein OsmY
MTHAQPRSDADVKQDVRDELQWEPSLQSDHLEVGVRNGIVTLTGTIRSYFERWTAENVARRVNGVMALHNEVRVKLEDTHRKDDQTLNAAVQNVLDWTTSLSTESITARVENGWVTLSGKVTWQFQRVAVNNAVRNLKGLLGVIDEITISPSVSQAVVRVDIEAALRRAASEDAQRIAVGVNGSQVILTGTVNSWPEQVAATGAAWNSPGVTDVLDQLTLVY